MSFVKVTIQKFIDDEWPGYVECSFVDWFGKIQTFHEKVPVVADDWFGPEAAFPQKGSIRCTVIGRSSDSITIDTRSPDSVVSVSDETTFVVPTAIVDETSE